MIDKLAADMLPHVGRSLPKRSRTQPIVPKAIIISLAHDAEIAVAAPVLEYSPLLSDDDLLELIATSRVEGVLAAIANREDRFRRCLGCGGCNARYPGDDCALANQNAEIRSETLDRVARAGLRYSKRGTSPGAAPRAVDPRDPAHFRFRRLFAAGNSDRRA